MLESIMENARAYGAEECELFLQESTVSAVKFQDNRLKSIESDQAHGVAVRVLADGRLGFATASDFGRIRLILKSAVEVAWNGDRTEISFPSSAPSAKGVHLEDDGVRSLQLDQIAQCADRSITKINQYDPAILAFGGIGKADLRIRVANSAGFDSEYRKTILTAAVGGELIDGKNILYCHRECASTSASIELDQLTDRVIADFEISRVNVDIDPGPKTVIFTPRAAAALFEVLELGLNGRNVEKGTSPIRGKLGEKILSEKITLVEDGLLDGGIGSAPFDDEGTLLERKTIVDHGVLKSFAVDLRSALKLHLPPTGNGFRIDRYTGAQTYESPPSPQRTNWLLLPGEQTYDEILAGIQDGVVVDLMMGLFTGNLLSGDFSANLQLAYRINRGKIAGRIKNAMVSGNFYDVFRDNLVAVSRETERAIEGNTTNVFPYLCARNLMIST